MVPSFHHSQTTVVLSHFQFFTLSLCIVLFFFSCIQGDCESTVFTAEWHKRDAKTEKVKELQKYCYSFSCLLSFPRSNVSFTHRFTPLHMKLITNPLVVCTKTLGKFMLLFSSAIFFFRVTVVQDSANIFCCVHHQHRVILFFQWFYTQSNIVLLYLVSILKTSLIHQSTLWPNLSPPFSNFISQPAAPQARCYFGTSHLLKWTSINIKILTSPNSTD